MSSQTNQASVNAAQLKVQSSLFTQIGLTGVINPLRTHPKPVGLKKQQFQKNAVFAAQMSLGNSSENQKARLFMGENINQQIQSKISSDVQICAGQPQPSQVFTNSSLKSFVTQYKNRQSVKMMAVTQGSTAEAAPLLDVAGQTPIGTPQKPPSEYMFARSDFSVEKQRLNEVLDSGVLFRYHAPDAENIPVSAIEKKYAEMYGFKYALGCNSASSGLLLSLLAAGVEKGDKVLMPAFTFVAVPSTIVLSGATPVLVEIDESYAMDPDHLEEQIQKYQPKYMMLSYMRGALPDMDKIMEIVNKYDIVLIEDIAHAMGVKWKGQQVGTFGQSSVTSFQSHKICDAGEGGMLGTNDIDVFLRAAFLSGCYETNIKKHLIDHPEKQEKINQYVNKIPPYNLRMSNMTAALLFNQFDVLEEKAQKHRDMYKALHDTLDKTHLTFPPIHPNTTPTLDSIQFGLPTFTVDERKEVQSQLNAQGIPLNVIGLAENNARVFYNWQFIDGEYIKVDDFPRTKYFIDQMTDLRLPAALTQEEAVDLGKRINNVIADVIAKKAKEVGRGID